MVRHPVFLSGRYNTGFIDAHMDGGRGPASDDGEEAEETRRVAFMLAAIAAYRRDKQRAARAASGRGGGASGDLWKSFARRAQMRGDLR